MTKHRLDQVLEAARKERAVIFEELGSALKARNDLKEVVQHLQDKLKDNLEIILACEDAKEGR